MLIFKISNYNLKGRNLMTKTFAKRAIALVLALVTVFSISITAFAAEVSSYNCAGDKDGYVTKTFYVKTGSSSSSRKTTITCGKGSMIPQNVSGMKDYTISIYGCYEVTISYWNGSKWVQEDNFDIYNKSSRTLTFDRKNTYYKVQVYSWKTSTIMSSYLNKGVLSYSITRAIGGGTINPVWKTVPTCTAKPGSGCTMYNSNPV